MPKESYYMSTRRLVSQEDSSIIERAKVPRSKFINQWTRKTTFDAGLLIPFLVEEVLPGDHTKYRITPYVRLSTPLFPIFDNQRVDIHVFFTPNRLVWSNWTAFMGETDPSADPVPLDTHVVPYCRNSPGYLIGSIFDHMGLPTEEQAPGELGARFYKHTSLPLRAYNLIINNWYRDQNLIQPTLVPLTDGEDTAPANLYTLFRRAKSHDPFTAALPFPQKFIGPTIPLGGLAPITGIGVVENSVPDTGPGVGLPMQETGQPTNTTYDFSFNNADPAASFYIKMLDGSAADATNTPQIFANLGEASGISINTLREAWLVQSMLEKDARGGTRYIELIRNHFGVRSPDSRLFRPEYIGGGNTPLSITPIAQTAPGTESVVGALGAAGTAVGTATASYAATEHGWIIGLISVKTELSYFQGLHKKWTRWTRHEHYFPTLAGLGEQAILNREIYCVGDVILDDPTEQDAQVFGYQERFWEYRQHTSEVTGMLKSNITGTLDMWHLAQWFDALPTLDQDFIRDNPPMARVLAAGPEAEGQQYLADIMISAELTRALPTFGTPVNLARF